MRRKALIHYRTGQQLTSQGVFTELAKTWHLHFCGDRDCRMVYECRGNGCDDPSVNERCHLCRGRRRPVWDAYRDPRECCLDNCVLVTGKADLIQFRLAGPGPWFQCKTCARCHGWPCNL